MSILSSFLLFGKELLEKNFKKTCQCKSCLHDYSVEISDTFLSFLSIDSVIVLILCYLCLVFAAKDHCFYKPCQNNGTCDSNSENYTCSCPPNYTGKSCEGLLFREFFEKTNFTKPFLCQIINLAAFTLYFQVLD